MIGMDDLMVSVHGEFTAVGVAYDCEFEPKPAIVCPAVRKDPIGTLVSPIMRCYAP